MTRHLDEASLLEILYLNEGSGVGAEHLARCTSCHDNFAALRSELEHDRSAHAGRIVAKPEQFWRTQRDEIVARATSRRRGAVSLLQFRPAISILILVLLVAAGLMMMRTADRDAGSSAAPPQVTELSERSGDLFEEGDLRALDPWKSDELESLHQMVEWEQWIEDDTENAVTDREKS